VRATFAGDADAAAAAADEMVERTSTASAPWTLVPGNSKKFARLTVLETLCAALERAAPEPEPS